MIIPDYLRLTPDEEAQIALIREKAKARHELARKKAYNRGRVHFPAFPYECSAAFETEWLRKNRSRQWYEDARAVEKRKRG